MEIERVTQVQKKEIMQPKSKRNMQDIFQMKGCYGMQSVNMSMISELIMLCKLKHNE